MTSKIFENLKQKAQQNRFETAETRIARLKKLQQWIKQHESDIEEALFKDFKKPAFETQTTEIIMALSELKLFINKTKCWMKDKKVPTPISLIGHQSFIRNENKGVILIIAPWNYPFQLSVLPLIPALAAGNTVVIKPSELTPHTSDLVKKMCQDCFKENEVIVELGAKEKTEELLNYPFDHVFFTGSIPVGAIIAEKCARQLIPYTLELGGKSPLIIDHNVDIQDAVEKTYWGKFLNRGQICVAPDTIFIHEKIKDSFLEAYRQYADCLKAETPSQIITAKHAERLVKLSKNQLDLQSTHTLLLDSTSSELPSEVHKEEIFGPFGVVHTFNQLKDIVSIYNMNRNPLALYVFSKDENFIQSTLKMFPSGSAGVNTLLVQLANHNLPFGGRGQSGVGKYHGYFGFLEFSHQRAVIKQTYFKFLLKVLFPPYTDFKKRFIKIMKKSIT